MKKMVQSRILERRKKLRQYYLRNRKKILRKRHLWYLKNRKKIFRKEHLWYIRNKKDVLKKAHLRYLERRKKLLHSLPVRGVTCAYGCGQQAVSFSSGGIPRCCNNAFWCPEVREKRHHRLANNNPFKGRHWTGDALIKLKQSIAGKRVGRKNPMYGRHHSPESRKKISQTRIENGCARGNKNPNYHHGKTYLLKSGRKSEMSTTKYELWRLSVFERDGFTCQECGKRGGDLEADHLKPWAYFPELRYDISNGRTLCIKCHRKTFKEVFKWRSKK